MYDIAAGMARLEANVESVCNNVDDMKHRLFGNGQPGELTDIKTRLSILEKFRYILIGVGLVFSIIGGFAGAVIEVFTRSSR